MFADADNSVYISMRAMYTRVYMLHMHTREFWAHNYVFMTQNDACVCIEVWIVDNAYYCRHYVQKFR